MQEQVIEWAPFRLAAGVTEPALLEASGELQEGFLEKQPGFVRRELLRRSDAEWCDLVVWESRESVERAMAHAAESPVCHRYFGLMESADHDHPGEGVQLFAVRAQYAPVRP